MENSADPDQTNSSEACADPEGRTESPDPLKKHKNKRVLSNTGLDSLKNHKAIKPAFDVDHHRHASETPFKWRFAGGLMMARLYWYLDPPSPHQIKKTLSKLDPL